MFSAFFDLIKSVDNFRKILLLFLTGLTCLTLFLGYRVVLNDSLIASFVDDPRIISVEYPCYLEQLNYHLFSLTIRFPVPEEVVKDVQQNIRSFRLKDLPPNEEISRLCFGLQTSILSDDNEEWLRYVNDRYSKKRALRPPLENELERQEEGYDQLQEDIDRPNIEHQ